MTSSALRMSLPQPPIEVVAACAADRPVVAEVAEDRVVAVARHEHVRRRARPVAGVGAAAGHHPPLDRRQVQQELRVRSRRLDRAGVAAVGEPTAAPLRAVHVEQDRAARVVLVVQPELAETRHERLRREPRIEVGAEQQQVARVVRARPVRADQAVRHACGAEMLHVGGLERLAAADRVVTRAAVQEVVVPAAEDHVVGVVGVIQRHVDEEVSSLRVRAEVVRRDVELLLVRARDVDRRRLHHARRIDELVEHIALARLRVRIDRAEARRSRTAAPTAACRPRTRRTCSRCCGS